MNSIETRHYYSPKPYSPPLPTSPPPEQPRVKRNTDAEPGTSDPTSVNSFAERYEASKREAKILQRIYRAAKKAKAVVAKALKNIHAAWNSTTRAAMEKLFGKSSFSESEIKKIEYQLTQTEKKLDNIVQEFEDPHNEEPPIGTFQPTDSTMAGITSVNGGYISIAQEHAENASEDALVHTIIHEATHSAVGTSDHWYVIAGSFGRYKKGKDIPDGPISFDKAVENADTITRAAEALSNNETHTGHGAQQHHETRPPSSSNHTRQTQEASPAPAPSRTSAAAERAISKLEQAKAKLYAPWDEATTARMYRLYGREGKGGVNGFSDADIARIAQRLDDLIATLKDTRDGQRQPQLRQDAANLDDAALEAELVRDATLASGASDRWNVRETPGGLVNAPYGSSEYIDPEDISLDDALQNGYTLRYTIDTLT